MTSKDEIEDHDHMYCPSCHHVMCLEPRDSPPVPDDVADKDLEYLIKQLPTDYSQSYYGSSTINKLRAASTPPVPADTINIKREVLQGVREALKYWIDGGVDYHVGEVALASLDAVLSEGE